MRAVKGRLGHFPLVDVWSRGRDGGCWSPVLAQRVASEGDIEAAGMVSVLAEPPRWNSGRSMRAVETTPAASLSAGVGKS